VHVKKIQVTKMDSFGDARAGAVRIPDIRNSPHKGSATPATLLAALLLALVIATAWIFIARFYAAPAPITSDGVLVDRQYRLTLYVTGAIFILAQLGLAFAAFRFRDHGQRARFSHGNVAAEATWISVTLVLFIGLGIFGRKAWADVRFTSAPTGVLQVEVTENQFVFNFRYPGPDGKFGRLDPALVDAPDGNPLGLDPHDPAARDDVVVPTLTIPVDRPVELLLRSQDVIHNFFVRELRLQQDAVPGMVIPVHFTPERIGHYEIVCTQLCGLGHYKMRSFLDVVSAADYNRYLSRQSAAQAATPQAAGSTGIVTDVAPVASQP
jgi:cytochrome c oxidase subunit II